MKEIMVAIDGSKHSAKIVDTAVGLAKSLSAKIVLVYIAPKIEVPDDYVRNAKLDEPETVDYYEEFWERVLGDLDEKVEKQKVPFETLFGVGNPVEFVLEQARERGTSMIVIGVHGLHRIGKLRALGSTSRRIIENSPIPVVAVP